MESNKRKRAEKKSEAEKLLADYAEAKKTKPKLTKAAFKRRRISLNQVNNENKDPTQTIPSAQETSSETLNNKNFRKFAIKSFTKISIFILIKIKLKFFYNKCTSFNASLKKQTFDLFPRFIKPFTYQIRF